MQNQFDPRTTGANTATVGVPRAARDAGLRSYMLSVYNYMASGVLLTGIVALLFASSGLAAQVLMTPLRWLRRRIPAHSTRPVPRILVGRGTDGGVKNEKMRKGRSWERSS